MINSADLYIVPSRFDAVDSKTSAGCVGALELARKALENVEEDETGTLQSSSKAKL